MANQSKLKAWVRYDGTGRVISGGPIFQVNKPKVGNWKQVDANLCCNGTTGTTTTQGGGGVTPTAFVRSYWLTQNDSCTTTTEGTVIVYSSSSTFGVGITVFTDAALTIPVTQGWVLTSDGMGNPPLLVGAGGLLSERICPPNQESAVTNVDPQQACVGNGFTPTLYYNGSLGNGTALFYDAALAQPYNPNNLGNYVRLYFQAQNQVCTMNGNIIQSYTAC